MIKKLTVPDHPMTVYTGLMTLEIKHKSMDEDGKVVWEDQAIYLDLAQSTLFLYKQTIMHELMHVALDMVGLDPSGEDEEMPKFNNEFLVTVSTNMIMLLAALNPELFEFVFSKD